MKHYLIIMNILQGDQPNLVFYVTKDKDYTLEELMKEFKKIWKNRNNFGVLFCGYLVDDIFFEDLKDNGWDYKFSENVSEVVIYSITNICKYIHEGDYKLLWKKS